MPTRRNLLAAPDAAPDVAPLACAADRSLVRSAPQSEAATPDRPRQ